MKEDFLHYLWQNSLYNKSLELQDGTVVEILSPGTKNHDSGPDFFNAKVKIGQTVWAGNVEIHVNASDWFRHNHHNDPSYDNIILHVVANNDGEIKRVSGESTPVIVLKAQNEVYNQYLFLMQSQSWVPCESFINKVNELVLMEWKDALLVERLTQKSGLIEDRYHQNNKNWEETFYQTLAYNFGFKINAQPFEMLAKSIPLIYLGKHKDDLLLIEALLFGQSGLLPEDPADDYTMQLAKDYRHLKNKFGLQPLSGHLWKFSKLRPANFPTIRIAQFARLIFKSNALMSLILEAGNFVEVKKYFDLEVSDYWKTHFVFEKCSEYSNKLFGESAFQNILINSIAPFFAFYSGCNGKMIYMEKAVDWLSQIKAEQNHIIKHWKSLGLDIKNAFDSQALIQLKNQYCDKRRCLNCRIGNQVIQHKY